MTRRIGAVIEICEVNSADLADFAEYSEDCPYILRNKSLLPATRYRFQTKRRDEPKPQLSPTKDCPVSKKLLTKLGRRFANDQETNKTLIDTEMNHF